MTTAERRPTRPSAARAAARKRRLARTLLVGAVAAGGAAALWVWLDPLPVVERCEVRDAGGAVFDRDSEQAANAATIAAVAVRRELGTRAATIAIATAMQESKLHNLEHGDRDSIGLFQQRPSQGWGTQEQILDPVYSANAFYDHLVKVSSWRSRPLTVVAQAVQRSAYPNAYARHETEAAAYASALTGAREEAIGCVLGPVETPRTAAAVAADLRTQLGVRVDVDGSRLRVAADTAADAWTAGSWAVAHADEAGVSSVTVGDRAWTRGRHDEALTWAAATQPAAGTTVVIVLAEA